jgi:hypothetical protein
LVYRLNDKYLIPPFFVRATLSFAIVFLAVTVLAIANWIVGGDAVLKNLPELLRTFLNFCGAYAALGAFFLYILMWIYLLGFDRTSIVARLGWAVGLVLTLPFGALVYYFVALSRTRSTPTVEVESLDKISNVPRGTQ